MVTNWRQLAVIVGLGILVLGVSAILYVGSPSDRSRSALVGSNQVLLDRSMPSPEPVTTVATRSQASLILERQETQITGRLITIDKLPIAKAMSNLRITEQGRPDSVFGVQTDDDGLFVLSMERFSTQDARLVIAINGYETAVVNLTAHVGRRQKDRAFVDIGGVVMHIALVRRIRLVRPAGPSNGVSVWSRSLSGEIEFEGQHWNRTKADDSSGEIKISLDGALADPSVLSFVATDGSDWWLLDEGSLRKLSATAVTEISTAGTVSIRAKVRGADGRVASGACVAVNFESRPFSADGVEIANCGKSNPMQSLFNARTNDSGEASLRIPQIGERPTIVVLAAQDGYLPQSKHLSMSSEGTELDVEFELAPLGTLHVLKVVNELEQPVPEARILRHYGPGPEHALGTTNEFGCYELLRTTNDFGSTIRISIRHPGYAPAIVSLAPSTGSEGTTIMLRERIPIAIRVIDNEGAPVSDCPIVVKCAGLPQQLQSKTDANGNCTIEDGVSGAVTVTAQLPGGPDSWESSFVSKVDVWPNHEDVISLVGRRCGDISVVIRAREQDSLKTLRVVDCSAAGTAGVMEPECRDVRRYGKCTSGLGRISGLIAGKWEFFGVVEDGRSFHAVKTIDAIGELEVQVVVDVGAPRRVLGRVRLASGAPCEGIGVNAYILMPGDVASTNGWGAVTSSDGTFALEGVANEACRVVAQSGDTRATMDIGPAYQGFVDLVLQQWPSVRFESDSTVAHAQWVRCLVCEDAENWRIAFHGFYAATSVHRIRNTIQVEPGTFRWCVYSAEGGDGASPTRFQLIAEGSGFANTSDDVISIVFPLNQAVTRTAK